MSIKKISKKEVEYIFVHNKNKEAYKIFGLYIGLFYVLPFFLHLFYAEEFRFLFKGTEDKLPLVLIFLFLGLVLFMHHFVEIKSNFLFAYFGKVFEKKLVNILILTIYFILSLRFSLQFDLSFRHTGGATISGEGFEVMLLFVLQAYARIYLLFLMLKYVNGLPIQFYQRVLVAVVALSLILTIMTSLDFLYIVVAVLLATSREKYLFDNLIKRKSGFLFLLQILLLCLIVVIVFFIGFANKIGIDAAIYFFTTNSGHLIMSVSRRISTFYVSVLALGGNDLFENSDAINTVAGVIDNMKLRTSIILGIGENVQRPEIWSVNRMNYLEIFNNTYNERTGASPGLVASALYLPFFPFNFILISLYVVFVIKAFNSALTNLKVKLNFFSRFLLLFFLIPLLQSPVDYLNIINPSLIYLFLFLGCTLQISNLVTQNAKPEF